MKTDLNLKDPDGFYEKLLDAQRGLTAQQCAQFSARLILLLANQVGDERVLAECIDAAAKVFARRA